MFLCNLNINTLGNFSLAPWELFHLHSYLVDLSYLLNVAQMVPSLFFLCLGRVEWLLLDSTLPV